MADNLTTTTTVSTIPSGTVIATRSVTYSGDASAEIAPTGIVVFTGSDDAKTATDVAATAAAAFPVTQVGSGTNAAGQTTVTNSSTSIISAREGRRSVVIVNQQTVAVYVDPSGGTATTSKFRLDPGAALVLSVTTAITGITSAAYSAVGDAKVHYIETY